MNINIIKGSKTNQAGKLGEALVVLKLRNLGFDVQGELNDADLVPQKRGSKIISFQVKATNKPIVDRREGRKKTSARYSFNINTGSYGKGGRVNKNYEDYAFNYYAFAALDIQKVVFMPKQDINQRSKWSVLIEKFIKMANNPDPINDCTV